MHMVGGRSPIRTKYKVGFNKTGKITALKVDVRIEGGWHPDISPVLIGQIETTIKKYNVGSFDATFTIFKTNNIPKGAVRAPGDVQGSAVADTVQDHVAAFLGMSGNKIREENLHNHQSIALLFGEHTAGDANAFTLESIWNQLKARTKLIEREKEVDKFNLQSRWLKRGVAMVTSVYGCFNGSRRATVGIFQDGSIVAEVEGVEMGQGLHTKVRQMIAYSLSPLCTKVSPSKNFITKVADISIKLTLNCTNIPRRDSPSRMFGN
jgi:indole-3-acetaldehyde oxidase